MERREFLEKLTASLKKNGADNADIELYLRRICSVTDEELADENISDDDIENLAKDFLKTPSFGKKRHNEKSGDMDLDMLFGEETYEDGGSFRQEFEFPDFEAETVPDNIAYPDDPYAVTENQKPNAPVHKTQKQKASPLFIVLLILTLPITLPCFLIICALAGALYVSVASLIVGLVAATVGIIAVGTALSLIGIIYGITKIKTELPVALYEIGVGIAVGGVTMLISVLLYNISIRFAPKLFRYVTKLAKYVFGSLADLYDICKKECGK